MANAILVAGDSGSGKSTSIYNPVEGTIGLKPEETFIFNVMGKPLPFRGSRKLYNPDTLPSAGGNYYATHDPKVIMEIMQYLVDKRPEIRNFVLDDFQYIMADEFMKKALVKGYEKFSHMARNAYDVIQAGRALPSTKNFICLTHDELDAQSGRYKIKTIGKMLEDKVNLAGLFTIVLYTFTKQKKDQTEYGFITNKTTDTFGNEIPAKSPAGMFEELTIPNDLGLVVEKVEEYFN